MNNSDEIIKNLEMIRHPEGGYYKESYRDNNVSLIYYLLKKGEVSHWHKLKKNEILHFYDGDPLIVSMYNSEINISEIVLGRNIKKGHLLHYVVNSKIWFSMKSTGNWSLIGCTVAPAFNFKDFELAPKNWSPNNN